MSDLVRPADFFRVQAARASSVLPEQAVRELTRHCRAMGVWLSVWDHEGQPCHVDAEGPAVWTMLWERSPAARDALADIARCAMKDAQFVAPWGRVLNVTPVVVRHRGRVLGAVLAGWARANPASTPDEDFCRLCDQSQLDATALIQLARGASQLDEARCAGLAGLLEMIVQQARQLEAETQKVESFSRNLEESYEELTLIYGLGDTLPLNERLEPSLIQLANDVLTVTRTAGLAILIANPARGIASYDLIRVGAAPQDLQVLVRLAESLGVAAPVWDTTGTRLVLPPQIVRNRTADHPELSWAASWLQHAVALPLGRDRFMGVLLAINRTDDTEFNSVQIKFLRAVADRIASFLEKKRLYDDLAELSMGMLHALVSSIDAKDPYTCGHSERVAITSRMLARQAGFSPATAERVYLAGLLHDVGKIGVPDAILCKPGKLTEEEFTILRRHPEIGARILSRIRQVEDLLPGILYHHERMDGRGYPHRLAGPSIPLLGRIICLADCFDAMTTNRTYRAAMPIDAALAEVRRCAGTQFDPLLAEKFFEIDLPSLVTELNAIRTSAAGQLEGSSFDLSTPQRAAPNSTPGAESEQAGAVR